MKTLTIFILLLAVNLINLAHARVVCEIPRLNQNMIIDQNEISFFSKDDAGPSREIASVIPIRASKTATGFIKTVKIDGLEYKIIIEDMNNFSDVLDMISIKNEKGHEIMYPIHCK